MPEQLRNQGTCQSLCCLTVPGLCNAVARGISISLDPLGSLPHPDSSESIDFEHYGIDNLGARFGVDPHPDDPMVHVPPVITGLREQAVALLNDQTFKQELNTSLSPLEAYEDQYIQAIPLVSQMVFHACSIP